MGVRIEGIGDVKRSLREQMRRQIYVYLGNLDKLAMDVVSAIRDGSVSFWKDHSGNLRNSIGYIILYDGARVFENFKEVVSSGKEGVQAAKSFADELATKYPSGIVLIIVAGMEYAAYVEAVESRTVLAGGELLAKKLLAELEAKRNAKLGK